ncbi:MAG TPA: hypothetical protein VG842_08380 [Sediminibacterium sp.]|nr:hypothetical protein [Sediminibacterium sp.]
MSYFDRSRWWVIAFLLLVALNIATLGALWLIREKPGPPRNDRAVVDFMVQELGLDSMQRIQLEQLRRQHQEQMKDIRSGILTAKNVFFDLLQQDSIPDSVLQQKAQAAAAMEAATDLQTFRHFQAILRICRPDQRKKFMRILHEILRQMAPPQPGERPGPPPGGRPPMPEDGPPPPRN